MRRKGTLIMQMASSVSGSTYAEPNKPVVDPAGWTKDDLTRNTDWLYPLNDAEIADLDRALAEIERRGIALMDIQRDDFNLPILGPVLESMREQVVNGRGFVWIRGVPVHRYTRLQSAIVYWGIGTYMGEPVSQNSKGHMLGHVVDLGDKTFANPTHRGYQTSATLPFHADFCDIVGLLCLQRAKSGGDSAIASSITMYNEMLKRYPAYAAALCEPIYRDRRNEIPEGAKPYFAQPVFMFHNGQLTTHFGAHYMTSAQRFEELPRHSEELVEAIKMFDVLAKELCFAMEFQQGDIQLLNNHVIVHSRTSAVVDYPERERRRHLLRLWLSTPEGRELPPSYAERYFSLDPNITYRGGILTPGIELKAPLEPE
jgi:Taurine catabolism dioxygenase TauD, TfdA family